MDIELAKCECCGLKEDCTQAYISEVKEKFDGKWLCGLCSEAVRDEIIRGNNTSRHMMFVGIEDAVKAHMSFCRKYKSNNPATRVADGMRQMLRRRRRRQPPHSLRTLSDVDPPRTSSTATAADATADCFVVSSDPTPPSTLRRRRRCHRFSCKDADAATASAPALTVHCRPRRHTAGAISSSPDLQVDEIEVSKSVC
nr:uncharacterized protein LOC109163807 [Ipomoea trifida]